MGGSKRSRNMIYEGISLDCSNHTEKRVVCRSKTIAAGSSLPKDLLIDVLSRVASSSFDDLFNAKLCCKDFFEAVEDEHIYRCVSIDKFPVTHWFPPSDRVLSFLTDCLDKGNPESLFRQGMIEYFSLVKTESGLDFLKKASEKGNIVATYVYGMILLWQGDRSCIDLLSSFKYSRPRYAKVGGCRDKIKSVLSCMWINNSIPVQDVDVKCQERGHTVRINRPKGFELVEEFPNCDSCVWSRELVIFCKIINGVSYY